MCYVCNCNLTTDVRRYLFSSNFRLVAKCRNYEGSAKFVTHFNGRANAAETYKRKLPEGMAANGDYMEWIKSQPWSPLVTVSTCRLTACRAEPLPLYLCIRLSFFERATNDEVAGSRSSLVEWVRAVSFCGGPPCLLLLWCVICFVALASSKAR